MTINQLGLLSDMAGVFILFLYGLPSDYIVNPKAQHLLINESPKDEVEKVIAKNRVIKIWAYIGLTLLFIGFIFQLIGSFK